MLLVLICRTLSGHGYTSFIAVRTGNLMRTGAVVVEGTELLGRERLVRVPRQGKDRN